jgi:glycosyltransferase involved in cell wall biosynthesis
VAHVPPLAYDELPRLAAEAAVLVMPYRDLPVTRAMQPLKLKEYLATGKPVVSRDLPAAREWADHLTLTAAPEEFSAAVRRHLTSNGQPPRRPPARLEAESWAAKAAEFKRLALEG